MSTKDGPKGKVTKDSVTLLPCFYFVELPILVSSVVSLYFLELTDMFKPVRSGFICHDRSLSLPYIEPTHEAVPFLMLVSLVFAAPAITIMIGEGILFCCLSWKQNGAGAEADINAAGCSFNSYIRRAVRFVGVHVFGLCATALITDIIQLATGYHTPYFLTVCKPNYTTLNGTCDENLYVMEDVCSGADPAIITAGRKSFPSQHATLASFAAVYVSMYFNSTLTDSSKLLKPLLVFAFIISAIICGLTRIIQYKNHAIDVYLGFILGGGIAVYLGLYAVGNFRPGDENATVQPPLRVIPRTVSAYSHQSGHHLPAKSCSSSDGLSSSQSESMLHRNHHVPHGRDCGSLSNLKRSGGDVEVITPHGPMLKESLVTFSNTLPRAHTPAMDDAARRAAAYHASMDSSRSKQLLSQWKSKNENRKLSLQGMNPTPGHSPPRNMEIRSSSEPSAVGLDGELLHQGPSAQYLSKLATGASATLPSNPSGIAGGARVSIQSRPGSSQLVHIPEETQENINSSPTGSADTRAKWQKSAEKGTNSSTPVATCRTNNQPRIMQVIAMSKQQGLIHSNSQSSEGSSSSVRYKSLGDQESGPGTGSTGTIVRVEAHPENGRPVVQPPSTDGSGSWTWKSQSSLRQSFELNDLNRDSESSESARDGYGSTDRAKRTNATGPIPAAIPTVPTIPTVSTVTTTSTSSCGGEHHYLQQGISTIRVTPIESSNEIIPTTESMSVAPSRDSTLRRKGNLILIPERCNSPDNTRNIFYKGTSSTPTLKEQ
ncbi:phospholipid phosphatase-related protein type 4 [Denticeps clupeoides]|uniref:Phospholipid phosphatase-related protein type 3 n=1 Tax=Denticeps clupeoides TaxID=299321 RepID=A0AAY4BUY7_9TELE|nr:phospholipid phosphatase-related protein type 4 [Denticeps clupeoides]